MSKLNEFFCSTEDEIASNQRKASNVSKSGSDILASDDHLNAFSNEEKQQEENVENINAFDVNEEDLLNNLNAQSEKERYMDIENTEVIKSPQKEEPVNKRLELLDYLFTFVLTDNELNYVLAGYFSKFLSQLITKYPFKIISYIFLERSDIIERLIYHSSKKSISEVIPNPF